MTESEAAPTHAGAVTVRVTAQGREYLLVGPKSGAAEWVLPKGHIEGEERPDEAALRELSEEAGVQGLVLRDVGASSFVKDDKAVKVAYFLVRFAAYVPAQEGRRVEWFPYAGAQALLTHSDARARLEAAEALATQILPAIPESLTTTLTTQLEYLNDRMKSTSDTANQFLDRYMFGGLVGIVGLLNLDLVLLKTPPDLSATRIRLLLVGIAITVLLLSRIYFLQVLEHYTEHRSSHRKLKYKYELTLHCLLHGTNAADYGTQLEAKVGRANFDPAVEGEGQPNAFQDRYPTDLTKVPAYLLKHHSKAAVELKPRPGMLRVALLMVVLTMSVRLGGLLMQSSGVAPHAPENAEKPLPASEQGP